MHLNVVEAVGKGVANAGGIFRPVLSKGLNVRYALRTELFELSSSLPKLARASPIRLLLNLHSLSHLEANPTSGASLCHVISDLFHHALVNGRTRLVNGSHDRIVELVPQLTGSVLELLSLSHHAGNRAKTSTVHDRGGHRISIKADAGNLPFLFPLPSTFLAGASNLDVLAGDNSKTVNPPGTGSEQPSTLSGHTAKPSR